MVKTIESLAPGLYEMLIEKHEGAYTVAFEARTIDDILKLGGDRQEEVEFAAVAGFSEWAAKYYELTWQPLLRALITPAAAEARKRLHPMRQQHYFFSRKNPLFATISDLADTVREKRAPAAEHNPFVQLEELYADSVERSWDFYRDTRDAAIELTFHALYGTPWMKRIGAGRPARPQSHDVRTFPQVQQAIKRAKMGGYAEGIIRMLVLLARARGAVRRDRLERSDRLLHAHPPFSSMTLETRRAMIREQSVIVEFCGDDAIATLADILKDPVDRYRALNLVMDVAGPMEQLDAPTVAMFKRFQAALLTLAHDGATRTLRTVRKHLRTTLIRPNPLPARRAQPPPQAIPTRKPRLKPDRVRAVVAFGGLRRARLMNDFCTSLEQRHPGAISTR